jgi:catechol 2,3-dioxygenase-like lactoylglutathione lyase family enzyme
MLDGDPWAGATPVAGLAIDHIGIVVPDLAPTLAWLRGLGFRVNDGVPLMGEHGPLGQTSAHCILANNYVEISAPDPGSGNHLEPLMAHGPGIRIVALASEDISADHARFAALGIAAGAPRPSSRLVRLGSGAVTARFVWFPLTEVIPGAITAVVQHHDRDIVFASELRDHPNGADRVDDILFGGPPAALAPLAMRGVGDLPVALDNSGLAAGIAGFTIAAAPAGLHRQDGFILRTMP